MSHFICPNCGAEVRKGALICPECGSDEETGWSESARLANLGIPISDGYTQEDYQEFLDSEFGGRRTNTARNAILTVLVGALVLLFLNYFVC